LASIPEIEAAAEKALAEASGQRFCGDVDERRLIEQYAMRLAEKHFRRKGFTVEDVSSRESFDLLCSRAGQNLYVEVKGTTTGGGIVILTAKEVQHAKNCGRNCILFIVHSIKLNNMVASGGTQNIIEPWLLAEQRLTPICYTYHVQDPSAS
jgi:hypothetical protein